MSLTVIEQDRNPASLTIDLERQILGDKNMSLTVIEQDRNPASLTIDLGRQILGDKIVFAEFPLTKPEVLALSPLANAAMASINEALDKQAIQTVSFERIDQTDRITLAAKIDAREGIFFKWNNSAKQAMSQYIHQFFESGQTPVYVPQIEQSAAITFSAFQPTNESEQVVYDALQESTLIQKTKQHGGLMTIMGINFKKTSVAGFIFNHPEAHVKVLKKGACGSCFSDKYTFKEGLKTANEILKDNGRKEKVVDISPVVDTQHRHVLMLG